MDKEVFRKTEYKLYSYYSTKESIKAIKRKIDCLEKQKESIEYDITHTNVEVDPYQNGSGIWERVQTSSTGDSHVETEIIKQIDKLERERMQIIKKILKNKSRKRAMEDIISNMDFNISMLNEESKRFLELKYNNKAKVIEISQKMNMAVSTVYRIRDEIIENIANLMKIMK